MMFAEMELDDIITREILAHLCGSTCHGFAHAIEVRETRGDRTIIITCPGCEQTFTLNDDQYDMLLAWSTSQGATLSCGVYSLPA